MVFSGTVVTFGRGAAVVTGTGMATELGRIAGLLEDVVEPETPLQREIARVGRVLGIAVVVVAIAVIASILSVSDIEGTAGLIDVMLIGVSLAVAAVPEGLRDGRDRRAGHRGAADGATPRDRPQAVGGRDARLGDGDLLRQDRHAHEERDDRARSRDRQPVCVSWAAWATRPRAR